MLNRQDLRVAKLKAAMYESRNIERLLSKAVRSYQDSRYLTAPKKDMTFYLGDEGERAVVVKNVPLIIHGETEVENILLSAEIEQALQEDETLKVQSSIEFDDLLN